jgi:hypothetical protein
MNYDSLLELIAHIVYIITVIVLVLLFIYVMHLLLNGIVVNSNSTLHVMPSNLGLPSVMIY